MAHASALELRRLTAAMWSLGLHCPLGCGNHSKSNFVLLILLKLQRIIASTRFASQQLDVEVSSASHICSDPTGGAAAAVERTVKTPKERLQLLQHVATFMMQKVGIVLDLPALFGAEGPAVSELLRLAEALAAASKDSLQRQTTEQTRGETTRYSFKNEEEGEHKEMLMERHLPIESTADSNLTANKVRCSANKVIALLQWFYGEKQATERRSANTFLQSVLTPEGCPGKNSLLYGRALLEQQLQQSRFAVAEVKKSNDALASQVLELRGKIRGAELDADRLSKQLMLLRRWQGSAAVLEEQKHHEMQEKLRQLYLQYARKSAACDTLTASVEEIANRAEAAAMQHRRRLQETRQKMLLEEAAAVSATETQINCLDTCCGGISEGMGVTLATSEHLCTEGSELDLLLSSEHF